MRPSPPEWSRNTVTPPASTLFSALVTAKEAGMRLDLWIKARKAEWSRKKTKALLDHHQVSVNGKPVYIASWTLNKGDSVRVHSEAKKSERFTNVIYEDDVLIAISKPPFTAVEDAVRGIGDYLKRKYGPDYHPYLTAMHRLDRDTSGVLLVSKEPRANVASREFKERRVEKVYLALVAGAVPFTDRTLENRLEKGDFKGGRRVNVLKGGADRGKFAVSRVRVKERYNKATLLEVFPQSGRTHQIRAQLASAGFPILGDKTYGSTAALPNGKKLSRQALHAKALLLRHPLTGKKLRLESPLPTDFSEWLTALRQ